MDCSRECGKQSRTAGEDDATSHGLCVKCYAKRVDAVEVNELREWVDAEFNRLPTGKIVLDRELKVIGYSKEEERLTGLIADEILGRRFFSEVAPCMSGPELAEWCSNHVAGADFTEKSIDWLLKLRSGDRVATLEMCAGRGRVVILVDITGHGAA